MEIIVAISFLMGTVFWVTPAHSWEKIVDYGDSGYSETGSSWRDYVSAQSYNGSYRYLSAWDRNVARVGTATWETTIPQDGLYRVSVSYRRTENRSPDANFFVTNSAGGMDEFIVNQRGDIEFIWRTLGEFRYYKGQRVKVFLDGRDDDYSDCADAVSWVYVKTPVDINPIVSLLQPERVPLRVTKDGIGNGTIVSSPGGISCGSLCYYEFIVNTDVLLEGVPGRGGLFAGWSGSGCSGKEPCAVSMTEELSVNGTFNSLPHHNLSVSITGTGTVTSSPVSADGSEFVCTSGTCQKPFFENETVRLIATEDRSTSLYEWSGDCSPTSDRLVVSVNMGTSDKSCAAEFIAKPQFDLNITIAGNSGGTGRVTSSPVSADGNAINCTSGTCTKPYYKEDTVTLTPTANSGSFFAGWSGDADCSDGVVTISSETSCTATFELGTVTQYELKVENVGLGDAYGNVTTSPNVLTCQGRADDVVSCSADVDENTAVTLTATPVSGNFSAWLGDCSGITDDPVVTFTMDEDKTCNAIFSEIQLP